MSGTPENQRIEGDSSALRPAVPDQVPPAEERIYDITPAPGGADWADASWQTRRPRVRPLRIPPLREAARRAVRAAAREAGAVGRWSRRPSGRLAVPGVVIAVLVGMTGTAGGYLIPATARPSPAPPAAVAPGGPTRGPTDDPGPTTTPAQPAPPVPGLADRAQPVREASKLAAWAQEMSAKTQIPQVAIEAYGYAEFVLSRTQSACQLKWTTLAALGKVESDHGRANGATVTPDGRAYPPIVGPPLNGQGGHKNIPDTDRGLLDNDPVWDRAIGPMQFIPTTWQTWKTDADNDGQTDPNDLDDSALAAAKYLCAGGRDMSTPSGWQSAILAYNDVQVYAQQVFNVANDYGLRTR